MQLNERVSKAIITKAQKPVLLGQVVNKWLLEQLWKPQIPVPGLEVEGSPSDLCQSAVEGWENAAVQECRIQKEKLSIKHEVLRPVKKHRPDAVGGRGYYSQ